MRAPIAVSAASLASVINGAVGGVVSEATGNLGFP